MESSNSRELRSNDRFTLSINIFNVLEYNTDCFLSFHILTNMVRVITAAEGKMI